MYVYIFLPNKAIYISIYMYVYYGGEELDGGRWGQMEKLLFKQNKQTRETKTNLVFG